MSKSKLENLAGEQGSRGDSVPPHNLPPQLTPFVGREAELVQLHEILARPEGRLITIVGTGGMGKTRLALALAEQELLRQVGGHKAHPYQHGVYFASLARLQTADLLLPAIAEAINFRFSDGDNQREQLLRYLAGKRMLLVLDNFEHLLVPPASPPLGGTRGGAGLIDEILRVTPRVKIVVTTRVRLKRQAEQLFPLGGMAYPPENGATTVGLDQYSAVRLFVQCARRVRPDFALTAVNQPHVLQICQLLQGMPLGIVLAASWLESLSPRAISQEMQRDVDFLATDMADVPRRQRSLRAAFNHSWRLLSQREQAIFCQMSIFRGGFNRAAAQAITGAMLRDLQALVNKSLLTLSPDRRYDMHELLRQFAAEKLSEDEVMETAVRNQFSRYYCQVLGEKEPELKSPQRRMALAEIQADLANIEDAWRWAVQHRLWPTLHQADHTLFWFYAWHFRFHNNLALCQFAVNYLAPGDIRELKDKDAAWVLLRVFTWLADSYADLIQLRGAESLLSQSQTLLQDQALAQVDTRRDEAFLFYMKAKLAFYNRQEALEFAHEGLSLARASGDQWQEARILGQMGAIFSGQSNYEMAQQSFNEGLALVRPMNDSLLSSYFLIELGNLARNMLDFEQSEAFFNDGLILARSQNDRLMSAKALSHLGYLKLFLGEFDRGVDYIQQAIALLQDNGYLLDFAFAVPVLAHAYIFSGNLSLTRQAMKDSLTMAEAFPGILQFALAAQARINVWTGRYKVAQADVNRMVSLLDKTDERTKHWDETPYGPSGWLALVHSDLETARDDLQKVVDLNSLSKTSMDQEWAAIYQATLGRAEWGLGQYVVARQHLLEALAVAVKIRAFITLLHVLPIVPVFLVAEEDVQHKTRAIEIYALAHSHPFIANCQFFYDIAGKDVEAVEADLPPDVVMIAKAKGQSLDFWETAESLLTELQELGWHEMRQA